MSDAAGAVGDGHEVGPGGYGSSPAIGSTMRAAVLLGPGRLEPAEVPVPPLAPDEVRAAVELCGVCGSDLHLVLEGWGRPGSWPGHEWVGRIVEVGEAVEGWSVGDRIVGGPDPGCGTCAMCRVQRPSLCEGRDEVGVAMFEGAFATFKRTPAASVLAVPDGLDLRAAALAEPLAVALHAVHQGGVEVGHRVLVLGAGPIGALAVAAMRAMGVDDIVCVEPNPGRQELARAVGATEVRVPDDLEVPSIAEPGRIVDGAVDVVLECSGKRSAMEAGLAQLRRAGRLVLVGAGIDPPHLDPNRILLNELVVTGAFNYDADGFEQALDVLAAGSLKVDALLEPGEVGLDELLGVMRDLAEGRIAGKVLVRP